ncbi:MAG: polyphosphate kinase 1 [Bdellovibrionaceae bacterium]|nr:polyphosphate kinase 1 [Pseudobdellovibrionaceae bacterium]NUM58945.1 polyphosphate kinase 1 [Pseudobdellovibrionaceae bacterium]
MVLKKKVLKKKKVSHRAKLGVKNLKRRVIIKTKIQAQRDDNQTLLSKEYTNREIGWLYFNFRVLHEAHDTRNPLLERVKFLSISSSNLDEFIMKRVGRVKKQLAYGITTRTSDGLTPTQQRLGIRKNVLEMIKEQAALFKTLKMELSNEKIYLLKWSELTVVEKEHVREFYLKNVFPVLTPLSVDPGHPFPFISNLSTSLGVTLKHPDHEEKLFARVKVPKVFPQWILLESEVGENKYVSLIDVIIANIKDLFPLMEVLGAMPFRLTRNADLDSNEDDSEDLLEKIEEEIRQRRFAEVVRLEHGPKPDPWMLKFLMDELELSDEDVYEHPGLLDYTDLNIIYEVNRSDLKYKPYAPVTPLVFGDETQSLFATIKLQDQLIHHPYESFRSTVERFVKEASIDPKVLAIKMTLYRTGDNSPFVKALIRAAEEGKQVVCLVELKARFDEERNIYWAQALENAGVHVVYGVVGLKTHAKTTLVVRQENEGLKCYAHIGTGNYNSGTSRFYSDYGLLTANDTITQELVEFFHFLTGRSLKNNYQNLLIAPINMFQKFKSMIERETANARQGKPAQIIAKFNSMEENEITLKLYEASQVGVSIDLIVRGFCCLRPGVSGQSENIRVISIIGRFLEHSRLFYFRNGNENPLDGDFFIGSADWMHRNLHGRVEAIVPIFDRQLKEKLWQTLELCLTDDRQSWLMQPDGRYKKRDSSESGVQHKLMQIAKHSIIAVEEG